MDAGNVLVKHGLINEEDLARARSQQGSDQRPDQSAIAMGLVQEKEALQALQTAALLAPLR